MAKKAKTQFTVSVMRGKVMLEGYATFEIKKIILLSATVLLLTIVAVLVVIGIMNLPVPSSGLITLLVELSGVLIGAASSFE